ncbi:MAG: CocE/NonD family hydrolase [Rhizomicrobium sp.]|nr:CocE/NonD family hydrolase [Rhizomicrobium sp.]
MRHLALSLLLAALAAPALAEPAVTPDMLQKGTDIAANWQQPHPGYDYELHAVMIPMRDGVKLYTLLYIPKGAKGLPILLERTPYNASGFGEDKPHMRDAVRLSAREWADDGYIVVYQDIRGKHHSQGPFVMTRPPKGPLNSTKTDDTTDAYDTIEWLVKNVPQSNGRVGMIGSSYDGWTVVMALLAPHPALKAAAPESPMIDGWMGDDWYHYGAFRQLGMDYFAEMTSATGKGEGVPQESADDYRNFLEAGSAGAWAALHGYDQLPWWKRFAAHPSYDAFWQLQALDKAVVQKPSTVPTLWLQGLWDQEDMYGAIHSWEALKEAGFGANNHLVMGPWYHSQINRSGDALGPLKWKGDTAADFRREVLIPFFNTTLKDRPSKPLPQAMLYNAAEKHWDAFSDWKVASKQVLKPLYLQPAFGLGFDKPAASEESYVSDPAKPVPFLTPPVDGGDRARWTTWLVSDQRPVSTRTDVLSYQTPVLSQEVRVEGAPIADLFAKTSGSDGDFVVKIIDVYPPSYSEAPELAGYQLPISLDIFRGRYRKSFAEPEAIPPGAVQEYKFRLPTMNYVFKPGHRIMVQIQSSLFPLYDRNPQSFVPNILFAKPADYQKATVTLEQGTSAVLLPIVAASSAVK